MRAGDARDARARRGPHLIGAVADRAQHVCRANDRAHDRLTTIFSTLSAFRSHGTAARHVKHARFSSGSIASVSRFAGGFSVAPAIATATPRRALGMVKAIGPSGITPVTCTGSPGCR